VIQRKHPWLVSNPLAGCLGSWRAHLDKVLDTVPADRLLVVRTERLAAEAGRIAEFGGLAAAHVDRVGMVVVYDSLARQHVIRPLTHDEFCQRCERQGRSQWQFVTLYNDPRVAEWYGTVDARRRWGEVRDLLPAKVERVREPEAALPTASEHRKALVTELQQPYYHTFDAFTLKGIVAAAGIQEATP